MYVNAGGRVLVDFFWPRHHRALELESVKQRLGHVGHEMWRSVEVEVKQSKRSEDPRVVQQNDVYCWSGSGSWDVQFAGWRSLVFGERDYTKIGSQPRQMDPPSCRSIIPLSSMSRTRPLTRMSLIEAEPKSRVSRSKQSRSITSSH